MDTDHYRSTKFPATIKIVSEIEPIEIGGTFTETDDGFELEFSVGDGKYVLSHGERTVLSVSGLISYTLDFCSDGDVSITTPAGTFSYAFIPESCSIGDDGDEITAKLEYTLDDGEQSTRRTVDIRATIQRGSHEN